MQLYIDGVDRFKYSRRYKSGFIKSENILCINFIILHVQICPISWRKYRQIFERNNINFPHFTCIMIRCLHPVVFIGQNFKLLWGHLHNSIFLDAFITSRHQHEFPSKKIIYGWKLHYIDNYKTAMVLEISSYVTNKH